MTKLGQGVRSKGTLPYFANCPLSRKSKLLAKKTCNPSYRLLKGLYTRFSKFDSWFLYYTASTVKFDSWFLYYIIDIDFCWVWGSKQCSMYLWYRARYLEAEIWMFYIEFIFSYEVHSSARLHDRYWYNLFHFYSQMNMLKGLFKYHCVKDYQN